MWLNDSDPFPFHRRLDAWSLLVWNFSVPAHNDPAQNGTGEEEEEEAVQYKCSVELEYHNEIVGEVTRSFSLSLSKGEGLRQQPRPNMFLS